MARPQRIELANAFYHVSNHRKSGKPLFASAAQVELFLEQVEAAGRRFNVEVTGWLLQRQGYQLLVRTPEANLSRFMRQVDGLYTLRCQQQGWRGPVFSARYKSVLLQPAMAKDVLHHLHYQAASRADLALGNRANSLAAYLGKSQWPAPFNVAAMAATAVQRKRLVEAQRSRPAPEIVQHFFARKSRPAVLGDQAFVGSVRRSARGNGRLAQVRRPSVAHIVSGVAREFAVAEAGIVQAARGPGSKNIPRWVAMHLCQELGAVTLQVIASHFGLQRYGTVSTTIGKLKAELPENPRLQRRLARLVQDLRAA